MLLHDLYDVTLKVEDARAILKAACREAHEHGQVEEWMISHVLSSDEKGLSTK